MNLTSLLVLTTLFISVSDSLPKTSYIKMIDVWLLASLCVPFAETILHTVISRLTEIEEEERSREEDFKVFSARSNKIHHFAKVDNFKINFHCNINKSFLFRAERGLP